MNYRITNGSVSYGAETILEEINFEVKGNEKIAIVGRNGSGKSTLLKSIINNEILEQGTGEEKFSVYKEGNPVIGYLKQIEFDDDNITMLDEILKVYKPIIDLEEKINKLVEKMQEDSSEELVKEYSIANERYEILDGYTYKKEYEIALNKFGFSNEDKYKKISEFSGGQRTKIAFIKLLLSKPDILLLDEPTNHLDIKAVEWLEKYLKSYPKAVIIVSHDRMFLDRIVNKVYEIEFGTITKYSGDYTYFENKKKENYLKQLKDYEYQQKEIKRLNDIANRFRYKPTKAKMAMSKLKQIERMVKIEEPNKYDLTTFKTNFEVKRQSGTEVLSVRNLQIGYKETLQNISFNLYKGKKLGVIGENGIGKSTLLKTLVNRIDKINGEFDLGYNVKIGYFDQQMALLDSNKTVIEEFSGEFPNLTTTEIRSSLASFMFFGEDVFKQVNKLSGGEKVRLQLCKILKRCPNLLILDEPTNHMDIIGKESLENLLKEYNGTVIFVSHDRFFINKIADCLLVFEKGKVTYFDGKYNQYEESKVEEEQVIEVKKEKVVNNTYLMQKEKNKIVTKIKKLEKDIGTYEQEIKILSGELLKEEIYTDYAKLQEIQNKIEVLNKKIDDNMEKWENLQKSLE
ncbi:MAG: ABC-F type ribosomal protection protein [Clostridia bacterium]|nr:ABC-F type ribosomal protection protein [Clostridia bacterium]